MKKLINVTYSVQYETVLELEINEGNLEDLERIDVIKYETDSNCYEDLFSYNQGDALTEIEIPESRYGKCQYVDNSCDIISFSLIK